MGWTLVIGAGVGVALPWLLYPGVMWILARLVPRPVVPDPGFLPTVTCILASRDGADAIAARVRDFRESGYPRELLSVVVGLDWSARANEDAVRRAVGTGATVAVAATEGGKATALNAAVAAATGEILVFSDSGQRFDRETVPALVASLADRRFGAMSGRLHLPEAAASPAIRAYWRLERGLRRDEAMLHSSVGVTGSVYALRRERWQPLPAGLLLDDLYVPLRLVMQGGRVGWCEAAGATESRQLADSDEYRRKVRTLTGNLQTVAWLPGVLLPWRNPVCLQLVFHKLFRLLTPLFLAAGAIGALLLLVNGLGALPVAVGVAVGLLLGLWGLGRWSGQVRHAAGTAIVMQAATLRALWSGLRGDWDVWKR